MRNEQNKKRMKSYSNAFERPEHRVPNTRRETDTVGLRLKCRGATQGSLENAKNFEPWWRVPSTVALLAMRWFHCVRTVVLCYYYTSKHYAETVRG